MRLRPRCRVAVTSVLALITLAFTPSAAFAASEPSGSAATASTASAQPSPSPAEQRLITKAEQEGPQRVIVQLDDKSDQAEVLTTLRSTRHDYEVNARYRWFPLLALRADSGALRDLAEAENVVDIQPDTISHRTLASSIPLINGDDVHQRGLNGSGEAVAILDDGIDRDHPFVAGRIVAEACFSSDGGDSGQSLCPNGEATQTGAGAADAETAACRSLCGHGTHVAGIAAGSAAGVAGAPGNGVAPGAGIIAIQVFTRFNQDSECDGAAPCLGSWASDQILALDHVRTLTGDHDIAAVNMSLGDGDPQVVHCDGDQRKPAFDALLEQGVATVVSAGNEFAPAGVSAPACISTAVAVGATDDNDNPADFGNRGELLDLFAPGVSIESSVPDDTYGVKDGTSMAAPHVAGAFAVLSAADPGASPGQLLSRLQDTGVPITYGSGGTQVTTPRIDLLAAVGPEPPQPPVADAGGPYTTEEGQPVTLNGSGANATSLAWDLDGDGAFDDATGASPTFDRVGQDGVTEIALRATGPGGTDTDSTTVSVTNVAPAVEVTVQGGANEGGTLTVSGRITDPGWLDPLSATIDYGPGEPAPLEGDLENGRPNATLTFDATHVYGDNGSFTVTVCGSDDDTRTCRDTTVEVANVDPDAAVDTSSAVDTPGGKTVVVDAHDELGLSGRVTDPGSDDLTTTWDFGDGKPSPDESKTSLVNPPNPDPPRSPSVQPRDITHAAANTYTEPCLYEATFAAGDDDGGKDSDQVAVVVQGNALLGFTATPWYLKYTLGDLSDLGEERLTCYLEVGRHMSRVFSEERSAATMDAARDVLAPTLLDPEGAFDRQLLAAWLNFAHGSLELDEKVDTDGLLHPDTTFYEAVKHAEAVRLDPDSSARDIRKQTAILTKVNLFSTVR